MEQLRNLALNAGEIVFIGGMMTTKKNRRAELATVNERFLKAAHDGDLPSLIEAQLDGANVNCREQDTGRTALHIVVEKDNLLLARYLADQCNAVFCADARGEWPTIVAASSDKAGRKMNDYIVEAEARYLHRIGGPGVAPA